LGRISADGADVVDHLAEIPLPGRIAGVATAKTNGQRSAQALPSFVAGPENRLAAATVSRMMSGGFTHRGAPPVLALFGPSSVGKTHLARGLVRHWQREFGDDGAHYTTAADFRRELSAAIEAKAVESFRLRMRGYRMLAIDDIHRLPSSKYLAHEFRSLLDAFQESGGTVIVTSSGPADSLGSLPPDVRSRIACGLQLQLAAPGKAARLRIIRYASVALGRSLSDEAANQLADAVHGTVPDLFGVLFGLLSKTAAGSSGTSATASQPLPAQATSRLAMPEIIGTVSRYMCVPRKMLKGKSRRQSFVFARATAIYLARKLTDMSYDQIGKALGGRDHTTIMHSYQKIDRDRLQNPATQETLDRLQELLPVGAPSMIEVKLPAWKSCAADVGFATCEADLDSVDEFAPKNPDAFRQEADNRLTPG
jgi:chromosomal replication initiator protein